LWFDLPQTYAVMTAGTLSEQVTDLVIAETRHLDVAQRRQVDAQVATGDRRSRDQIMADTMVELLTGRTRAGDIDVNVQLTMPLTDPSSPTGTRTATLSGYGPLPADLARELITTSRGRKWWRRLFTAPTCCTTGTGPVIGGDPARRRFDGWLADLSSSATNTAATPTAKPHPPPRPHPPLERRRPDHPDQRPRHLRPRQPRPRNARPAGHPHLPGPTAGRSTHWAPQDRDHHPHRTHLPKPSPGSSMTHEGLIDSRSVRNRNASANG
jgi:hypothetical protein